MIFAVTDVDLVGILDAIVSRVTGTAGAFFLLLIVLYFTWRLFREAQRDLRTSETRVDALTAVVEKALDELRAKRR